MIVYHRTTRQAAASIHATGVFLSREVGEVCVSDMRDGYADGYGETVVVLDIPEHLLTLDDEFQTGEHHYRVNARDIRPDYIQG